MGTFRTFVYDLAANKLTATYDQIETRRLFGEKLGMDLKAADDECIRTPPKCYTSTNHLERNSRPR